MIYSIKCAEPVRAKDGSWHMREFVRELDIPDDKIRETETCTICGNSSYPDCKQWCQYDRK